MITPQQLAAAQTFLAACDPANSLQQRLGSQSRPAWHVQRRAAEAVRGAARSNMQALCGTRTVYQEAIAAAKESRRIG